MGRLTCVLAPRATPGDHPVPEDHRATALGYWWGWVRSGAWTLGAQNLPGAKVKVREPRWMVAPGGAGDGGCGRRQVCAFCRGGGRGGGAGAEKRLPLPYPPPLGVSAVGLLGASQVSRQGGRSVGRGPAGLVLTLPPHRGGGQGPRCLGRGPDRPPAPGAPCSAVPLPALPEGCQGPERCGGLCAGEGLQRRPRQPTTLGFLTPPRGPSPSPSSSGPSPGPFRLCPLLSPSGSPLP